ncbi:conjugal transfer protein TraN [Pseudomonas sp. GX19020]|uniref:conjugal transfer protein TraN n=1 Tax=Pseudomonas sp. GX19020 TaxID=2942277 RepID=UPI00201944D6|nr:conjugal transfer protein TraN [Pseudomonas sp. GX19020]MCL4068142.1 conjugal transfer protein TraN [Pseudomonas sp. GX19020]
MRRALIITTALIGIAQPAFAQEADFDPTARAKAAGGAAALGSGSPVFSMESVTENVTPYEGSNTPETSINNGNIESRVNEVISGSSDAARAYQGSMDSITLRPSYDLSTDHIGVTVADQATISAEDIAGRYFTSTTNADPACNFTDFNVLEPFERFCDVHSNIREETCTIDRIVEVDRRDTWRCDLTTDDITVRCTPGQDGTCAVEDLPEGNPESQCTFLEERCVAWENALIREPAIGELFNAVPAEQSTWFNDGIFLIIWFQGVNVATVGEELVDLEAPEYLAADGCTYFRGDGHAQWIGGVYRTCPGQGICREFERDYSCQTNDQCASLAANASCERTEQTCLTTGPNGCELDRSTYSCFNDLTNHAPAALIDSRIERIEDRLVNSCDPSPAEKGCIAGESVCAVGQEVRTVMGFPVSRDCWQYSQSFTCLAEGMDSYTDCGPFQQDASCEVIGQTCLSFVESDETVGTTPTECQHWEYQYRCGGNINIPDHCTAFNVCVGELCEGIVDEPNTDFGNAAAWLTVLDEAAKDSEKSVDMQNVTLFSGTGRNCKVGALSTINCCRDSGWANGILGDCSESELALMDRIQAKAAVYVGTYCSRKVLGVCLQKRRSYCTFNSQLGMVFQKEIRRLSGRGWGSAKSPNCIGLPLDQIESLDWDQIDLSEAFVDMMNDAAVPTTDMVTDYLRDRLELSAGAISQGD